MNISDNDAKTLINLIGQLRDYYYRGGRADLALNLAKIESRIFFQKPQPCAFEPSVHPNTCCKCGKAKAWKAHTETT